MTSKVDPRTVRVKIFITAVDSQHRYSNESERADEDIYDDFKLNKTLWSPWFIYKIFSDLRVTVRSQCVTINSLSAKLRIQIFDSFN